MTLKLNVTNLVGRAFYVGMPDGMSILAQRLWPWPKFSSSDANILLSTFCDLETVEKKLPLPHHSTLCSFFFCGSLTVGLQEAAKHSACLAAHFSCLSLNISQARTMPITTNVKQEAKRIAPPRSAKSCSRIDIFREESKIWNQTAGQQHVTWNYINT